MSRQQEEYTIRKQKLQQAQNAGVNVFPARINRTHSVYETIASFEQISADQNNIAIAGRLMSIRLHGGSCFAHLYDGTATIQVYFKKDEVGPDRYQQLKEFADMGDFVQCAGTLFMTRKGEQTLLVKSFDLIAKALLPLPEKWHGLSDTEIRYRKRYLDLLANQSVKHVFIKRAGIVKAIRTALDNAGFIEVETPVLQPIPGGANAQPFVTHHNALDHDFYLRIAPELYLKRLIVGGMNKVYEFARCFRNEGIDREHNPEFTQVEFYAAYWDYQRMMEFTQTLIHDVVQAVEKNSSIEYKGVAINFTPPFDQLTFHDAILKYTKINLHKHTPESLINQTKKLSVDLPKNPHKGKVLDELFKTLVRPHLLQPTFIIDHPIELSPLAKKKADNEKYVERFQLLCGGTEVCNAFSELNDPLEQEDRFQEQEQQRTAGDEEAQRADHAFIEALSHGMPPTAGIGIGIDRLTAIITNQSNLKEVMLFPTLKPKQ